MSIRKKLILSHIAMIVVPTILFVLIAALLVASFFSEKGAPNEASMKGNEWVSGLSFLAQYEPGLLTNKPFLEQTAVRLKDAGVGIIVERNGRLEYASPFLADAGLLEKVQKNPSESRHWGPPFSRSQVKLDNASYSVTRTEFKIDDSGSGGGVPAVLYVLEDTSGFARFFGMFFPILFLVLLLVIGTTNGLLSFLVSRSIVKPLYALKNAALQIKDGNLDYELTKVGNNEIGELGSAFEEMRLRLRDSIATQLQYEENRKALLANISHDLQTPITAISNCVEGLKDGIADTQEKQRKYYDMIQKKAFDMNRLIEELFLFSKLDLRKMPFHIVPVDLGGYMHEFVEELRHDPRLQDIRTVVKDGGGKPLYVMADREKLNRVLSNIVDNSVKHMDKTDKQIEIELMDGLDEVTVRIGDNGRGIDAASLPRIFERFYREDRSRNADTGGSGLGLAIVEQIIAEHGGRVWAESVPGEGLSLYFTLTKPERLGAERHENDTDH